MKLVPELLQRKRVASPSKPVMMREARRICKSESDGINCSLEPIAARGDPPARHSDGNRRCERPPQRQREARNQPQSAKGEPEDLPLHATILACGACFWDGTLKDLAGAERI